MMDVGGSIGILRYYAGWADKVHGQTIEVSFDRDITITSGCLPIHTLQSNENKLAYTRHEPYGVVVRTSLQV